MLQRFSFLASETSFEDAQYVVLPVPYSFSSGIECARETPFEVIKQSMRLPSMDGDFLLETLHIHTLDFFFPNVDPEKNAHQLAQVLEMVTTHNKIPIMIGGDHSITLGALPHFESFLMLDAHFDLMDSYMGSKYSHACVARRLLEKGKEVYFWGVREREPEENPPTNSLLTSPSLEGKELYLSLDMDVLDPSLAKVQTPSPGGKTYQELISFIEEIAKKNKIVGIDIVEGCAEPHTAQLMAKILTKILKAISYSSQS